MRAHREFIRRNLTRFGWFLLIAALHFFFLTASDAIVRVYDLREDPPRFAGEAPASYHKLEVVEHGQRVHIHPDGTRHVHSGETDVQGVFVAHVRFTRPGPWGVEILARQGDDPIDAARLTVLVRTARVPCFCKTRAARSAAGRRLNSPNTADPLPDIAAWKAPAFCSFKDMQHFEELLVLG